MELGYLWNSTLPGNINIAKESDPFALFNRLRYDKLDAWSYLTDQADVMFKDVEGISKTYGYRLTVYRMNETGNTCMAIVRFVYPGSPAEKAGIERGDILYLMNNKNITTSNYMDLFNSSNITLQTGTIQDKTIYPGDKTVNMQAVEMYLDPIREYKVIDKGSKKIGYLCYTDYVEASKSKLLEIFGYFKQSQVTDVVLDLRYNPGGEATTTTFLSSILVTESAVRDEEIFLKEIWNDDYMAYFETKGEDTNDYFIGDIEVNMDLDHIYVLTSQNTASASEATIAGLMPYLQVIQIGEPTHGKYCAAGLIQAEDKEIDNWAMALVIYKYANKNGYTDFTEGIAPTYPMEDDWTDYYPLGDERDPMLAKAISLITGEPMRATAKSLVDKPSFKLLPASKQPDARRGGMIRLDK